MIDKVNDVVDADILLMEEYYRKQNLPIPKELFIKINLAVRYIFGYINIFLFMYLIQNLRTSNNLVLWIMILLCSNTIIKSVVYIIHSIFGKSNNG